jgi:flagellar basal body-associated protein FliL
MAETASAPSTPAAQAAAARLAGMRPPGAAPAAPVAEAAPEEGKKKRRRGKKGAEGADGKKKKPVKPILAVVLLLVVGYVVKGKVMKPHYKPGEHVPNGAIFPLGSVTTNLSDGHLAQVTISLQLTAPANSKLITKDQDMLTATVVNDLGAQTYNSLVLPAGRAALRAQLLRGFQQDLGTSEGAQQVSAVYFTGFVLQ